MKLKNAAVAAAGFLFILLMATVVAFSQNQPGKDSVVFKKTILTKDFIAEGIAAGDVNHDGKPDILAGSFWFEAPAWKRHELSRGRTYSPDTAFSQSFLNFSMDVNQDGWIDLIRIGFPGKEVVWYENPKNLKGYWKEHLIAQHIGNESPALVDVDHDGRADLLCNDPLAKQVIWIRSPDKGDSIWKKYVISNNPELATNMYTHGLGFGDMNLDGRKDVVVTKGWWEAPEDRRKTNWIFHPADLGEDCSQMYVIDIDGDEDMDVISASAHNYGIWWHEQYRDAADSIRFRHRDISHAFSQTHALVMTDINGDGFPDLLTGKRYFAHNGKDPGALEPAVLFWFELKPGRPPQWIPHQIDDNSGVGLIPVVIDLNQDGLPDILVSNKKGVFLFERVK